MRENGILQSFFDFKSIYFSKMAQGNEYFVYYNFLFYLFVIPFTFIKPLFLGIKLYGVIAASLGFTGLYWCLKKLSVAMPFFWTAIIFSITGPVLLIRFFISRPFTLAPVLLLLLLYFLHKKSYFWVFFISFIYLFWHSSTFFFPLIVIFTYFIFEKFYREKGNLSNVLAGIGGVAISLGCLFLFAPGFFSYMTDIIFGVYTETILGHRVSIPEGNELYPANFFNFIKSSSLLVCALIITVSVFLFRYFYSKIKNSSDNDFESSDMIKSRQSILGASFFLSISFFLGTVALSRRFEDFFVFFSALFIVLSFDEILVFFRIESKVISKAFVGGLVVSFFYLFASNMLSLQEIISRGASVENFRQAGEWLDKNVPSGKIVFNTSWNWFPQLYYHSPRHNYVIGLEPRFLYVHDANLYWKWFHIGKDGYVCEKEDCPRVEAMNRLANRKESSKNIWYEKEGEAIANVIINDFHSSHVVTNNSYATFNTILDNSARFEKAFSGNNGIYIYKVKS
ncbi:MAG TPA: hypothetical protein VJH63_02325 [Candidatus Paceibacterota bacterium]